MALVLADRVRDTTTTTGTGTITLSGTAPTGYQNFSVVGNGNTTYYTINADSQWEVGIGTYSSTGPTLSRNTVLASSNGGALVDFAVGTKDVFITYPAEKAVTDAYGTALAATTATNIAGGAAGSIPYQTAANTTSLLAAGTGVLIGGSTPSYTMSPSLTQVTVAADPSTALQVATKQYVDTIAASGVTYHTPVKYEVPAPLTATYNNGSSGVGATLTNAGTLAAFAPDGPTASVGDRILVYTQTNAAQNGVYTVTTVGSGSVAWVLTRATDADTYALKSPNGLGEGDAFFVTSGNTGAGETYVMNTVGTITFGTTAINFVQVSDAAVYSAGTGLTLTGTVFSLTSPVATTLGGTGLTSFTSGGAVYATSSSALTTGTLPATAGGTGQSSYTTGDLIYATSGTALGALADVATGNALLSGGVGTAPAWGKVGLTTHVTGTLPVANGGTGATTLTGYLKGNGTSAFTATTTIPTSDLSGTISLTTQVSGTLGAGNGGTGISSYTVGDILYASATTTLSTLSDVATGNALISGGVSNPPAWGKIGLTTHVSGTLPVSNGGSGATTLTGYLKGNGTSAFTASATIPAGDITGAALTKADDTNVTLTLGGSPSTALLAATSITAGWTGQLAVSRGGTGNSTLASGYLLKGNGVSPTSASVIYDDGTNVGVGMVPSGARVQVNGGVSIQGQSVPTSGAGMELLWDGSQSVVQSYNRSTSAYQPLWLEAGSYLRFAIGGTERGRFDSNGLTLNGATSNLYIQPSTTTNNALVRAVNAGGTAYIGLDNSSGGLGGAYSLNMWHSGAYPLVFANSNTERMRLDTSGNLLNYTSVRAPIFYDYNNTAYYLDAAANSVFSAFNIGGGEVYFYGSATNAVSIRTGGSGAYKYFTFDASGNFYALNGSVYGGRFYDQDNTAYYVDPASTSYLNTLSTREDIGSGTAASFVYIAPTLYYYWTKIANVSGGDASATILITSKYDVNYVNFASALLTISAWNSSTASAKLEAISGCDVSMEVRIDNNNDVWLQVASPWSSNLNWKVINKVGSPTVYYASPTQQTTTPANSTSISYGQAMRGTQGAMSSAAVTNVTNTIVGGLTARADVRAPIFYDSDDTSYYVNPASGSVLGGNISILGGRNITLSSSSGSVQIKGDTGGWSNGLLFYGSSSTYRGGFGALGSVDSLSYYWIGSDYNTAALYIYASGYAQASGSLRAPIFYDSNDTGYYVDPNGTSVMTYAQVFNIGVNQAINTTWRIITNGTNGIYLNGGGYGQAEGSWRAPIFYDSNDTGYYLDPNGTSGLNRANFTAQSSDALSSIYIGGQNVSTSGSLWINFHSDADGAYRIGKPAGAWTQPLEVRFYTGQRFRASASYGGFQFIDYNTNGVVFDMANGGSFTRSNVDFYAPIMYDNNDSGYYVNPNGTSNFAGLTVANTINGFVSGCTFSQDSQDRDNITTRVDSGFYQSSSGTTAEGWPLNDNAWQHMLSCTHTNDSNYYAMQFGASFYSQGLFYRSTNGNGSTAWSRVALYGNNYGSSLYASIYYDADNTGYYCDPQNNTVLNYVYAYNWFRSYNATGWYNETYSGGIYMQDTTWVRVYNGKSFYVPNEIAATGNITAYYSDERLKTKTGGIDNALDKVSSLEGFLYVENDLARSLGYTNDKQQVGVSAQAVKAVLPEAVSLAPVDFETLEDGTIVSKSGEDYLTVDYSRLVPLLIEAIKELKSEVNDLKAALQ